MNKIEKQDMLNNLGFVNQKADKFHKISTYDLNWDGIFQIMIHF